MATSTQVFFWHLNVFDLCSEFSKLQQMRGDPENLGESAAVTHRTQDTQETKRQT